MKEFLDAFFALGSFAYVVIGIFAFSFLFAILSFKMNKNAKEKWLAAHEGAVKVSLETDGHNFITSKEIYARVVSGEAAVFLEKTRYAVWAMPGDVELEVTYTYTRPGVLHKKVSTTWGPTKVAIHVEAGKEYALRFDRKEEMFRLEEK